MQTLTVNLGDRSYPIHVGSGLLPRAGEFLKRAGLRGKVAVVTNPTVAQLYLDAICEALASAGFQATPLLVPDGEAHKDLKSLASIYDRLIDDRFERGACILALGGGVIGDLAGFAAAITRRGLDMVQVPTTLLAQVDSSVGGKTGINSSHGKNLVGAFHQPALVVADTALLDTLSAREFRAGYAEIVKYGLINDAGFFDWLAANWRDVFAGGTARDHAIATSCRAKAAIVARDERETADRQLLNLGHTFGHALEAAAGFSDALLHGEAVALGIALAFAFSARLGLLAPTEADRVTAHLAAVGLPTSVPQIRDVPAVVSVAGGRCRQYALQPQN